MSSFFPTENWINHFFSRFFHYRNPFLIIFQSFFSLKKLLNRFCFFFNRFYHFKMLNSLCGCFLCMERHFYLCSKFLLLNSQNSIHIDTLHCFHSNFVYNFKMVISYWVLKCCSFRCTCTLKSFQFFVHYHCLSPTSTSETKKEENYYIKCFFFLSKMIFRE